MKTAEHKPHVIFPNMLFEDSILIEPTCHPESPVRVRVCRNRLTIQCARCQSHVLYFWIDEAVGSVRLPITVQGRKARPGRNLK